MLQNLHVKNLALINETEVEFKGGLNILSGETGAGKSIIIGSINLALGEKVQKEMLRDNADTALVELVFYVENPATLEAVRALGIEVEDETIILSRKITAGRAIARINGEAVSASKMKEVAALLIDIHGQHEHQSLLSKRKHLEILDLFAKDLLREQKQKLSVCYREYRKLLDELEQSDSDTEERARELSFLEYEAQEIEDANLTLGEDVELEEQFRKYSNGKKILDAIHVVQAATAEEDESASERISRAVRELAGVSGYDKRVEELENQLTEIDNLLGDFNREVASYLSEEEFDNETYFEIEKRLDFINHLKSKYGNSIEQILESYNSKCERIAVLKDYDEYLKQLLSKINHKKQELTQLSDEVSAIRQKESAVLTNAIRQALMDLNFLDVRFTMEFRKIDFTENGTDEVEFMISTNPGEPLKPLGKVASGGELSRIMLAIKTVLAENDHIETLIFDEIDSGISGRTAQMVSEKMNELGRSHQIICITHLPQIAAMADTHFLIEKSVENDTTVSHIHELSDEESVQELARMLGGVEITDKVVENAREMKKMAYMKK
ncbi:MAG: DNA repair protein RecN [Lachnobacterium sp.]|nr:DNA repair protein RecN [Lachnobacterium sp.]